VAKKNLLMREITDRLPPLYFQDANFVITSGRENGIYNMNNLRKVLTEDISYLYLLAFLLTGDQNAAMQCVVNGLEDCIADNSAFRHWARSWSTRTIIRNAVQMIAPAPKQTGNASLIRPAVEAKSKADALIAAVIQLPTFERFVFVISVLEGYSDRDCSVLLHCTPEEINATRARVLQSVTLPGEAASVPAKSRSWQGSLLSHAIAFLAAINVLL
jgi:DNA-directed RNA polymerase specialized sigma24 family protein